MKAMMRVDVMEHMTVEHWADEWVVRMVVWKDMMKAAYSADVMDVIQVGLLVHLKAVRSVVRLVGHSVVEKAASKDMMTVVQ